MTFAALYAYSENFVLPLSHDEVVHGKGSLIDKMPATTGSSSPTLRAYYAFMWGWPGKKLLFMGQEFAQREEWNEARALDWWLLDAGMHEGVRRLIADLNAAYRELPALHARDSEPEGFEWLIGNDHANSVFAWMRKAPGSRSGRGDLQPDAGAARRATACRCRSPATGSSGSIPTPAGTADRIPATRAR